MNAVAKTCLSLIAFLYASMSIAGDNVETLDFAVKNRLCPSDTSKYELIRMSDACPKPSCTTFDCSGGQRDLSLRRGPAPAFTPSPERGYLPWAVRQIP